MPKTIKYFIFRQSYWYFEAVKFVITIISCEHERNFKYFNLFRIYWRAFICRGFKESRRNFNTVLLTFSRNLVKGQNSSRKIRFYDRNGMKRKSKMEVNKLYWNAYVLDHNLWFIPIEIIEKRRNFPKNQNRLHVMWIRL